MGPRASCSFSFLWRSTSEFEGVGVEGAGLLKAESLDTAGAMAGNCVVGEADGIESEPLRTTEQLAEKLGF